MVSSEIPTRGSVRKLTSQKSLLASLEGGEHGDSHGHDGGGHGGGTRDAWGCGRGSRNSSGRRGSDCAVGSIVGGLHSSSCGGKLGGRKTARGSGGGTGLCWGNRGGESHSVRSTAGGRCNRSDAAARDPSTCAAGGVEDTNRLTISLLTEGFQCTSVAGLAAREGDLLGDGGRGWSRSGRGGVRTRVAGGSTLLACGANGATT